jgi:uncharacterized tellurite resistance protein B-like protein
MEITNILNTPDSRKSFLAGLIFLAKADNVVDEREVAFFRSVASVLGLNEQDAQEIDALWTTNSCPPLKFDNMLQKKFFFRDAIQLCHIDGYYSKEEQALIRKFAHDVDIPSNLIDNLEDWAKRGMAWRLEADTFIMD